MCIICHFLTLQISVMNALEKICLAVVIAIAFASCECEKDNELGFEELNYIYSKAYDDDEYWREFGYGYSSSDSLALEVAKNDAYNALLLKALFNIYPSLQLNYDRSILADNNIAFDTIIKKNKNNYESYVALEVPIQVMEEAIKMAVEGLPKIYEFSYEENINYRILYYQVNKEFDKYKGWSRYYYTDDTLEHNEEILPGDPYDEKKFREAMDKYLKEYEEKKQKQDSINN